jgi:aminopeptidase N
VPVGRAAVPVTVVVLLSVAGCTGSGHPAAAGSTGAASPQGTSWSAGTGSSGSAPGDLARVRLVTAPVLRPATTASLGDPLFPGLGNGGYDVQRYDLRLTYPKADPRQTVRGSVTVTARATAALPVFDLDFSGGGPASLTVDGRAATFRRRGAELVVTPAAPVAAGATFTVDVQGFTARPAAGSAVDQGAGAFVATPDGTALAGQPAAMHSVFPCNDHPSDKATFTFALDVPARWTGVANGVPEGTTTSRGRTVLRYRQDRPMATELVQVAVGDLRVVPRPDEQGVRIRDVVPRRLLTTSGGQLAGQSGQIAWMTARVGPFPFPVYGRLAADAQLAALETQTLTIVPRSYLALPPGPRDQVLLHELAHQWFGDAVSPAQWSDVWLNEGHATWYQMLYGADQGSLRSTFPGSDLEGVLRAEYGRSDRFRRQFGPPAAPASARTLRALFNPDVYVGGALVLYALRQEIGTRAFEEVERRWVRDHRDGVASTADYVTLASQVAGRDLGPFLDAWLYGATAPPMPGHPDWRADGSD